MSDAAAGVGVRVGIVSWNTAELLDRCLAALHSALGELDAEVVVVDNASTDESAAVARAYAGVQVIVNATNVGYARGMNQALAGATTPALIALNPDTEPTPLSLQRLVAHLVENPEAAVVAPRLIDRQGALQHSAYRFPSLPLAAIVALVPERLRRGRLGQRWFLEGAAAHDVSAQIDWAIGAVHCIRTAALGGDPPYSERWFMYVEDLELCWRLRKQGWSVRFASDVDVVHIGNAAGAQAWGDTRTLRYMEASYEWYATEMGALRTRLWAALNALGTARHLAVMAGQRLSRSSAPRWTSATALRPLLRLHLKRLARPGSSPA